MLLRTSFSDPGIIPRATVAQGAQIEAQLLQEQHSDSNGYRQPVSLNFIYEYGMINLELWKTFYSYCFSLVSARQKSMVRS